MADESKPLTDQERAARNALLVYRESLACVVSAVQQLTSAMVLCSEASRGMPDNDPVALQALVKCRALAQIMWQRAPGAADMLAIDLLAKPAPTLPSDTLYPPFFPSG